MSYLQRALVTKSGYDCGFEYVTGETEPEIILASARHPAVIGVTIHENTFHARIIKGNAALVSELQRHFPSDQGRFQCHAIKGLRLLLERAAKLAHALPSQARSDFEKALKAEFDTLPDAIRGTEVERMVRRRVGQQTFRAAMLDYWGGACAVTGIVLREVLRASHAKPWADCESDAERLDVFNGFLLSANLDALFDRFLISFDEDGRLLVSDAIPEPDIKRLDLDRPLRLRWLATEHEHYLDYHRARYIEGS